MKSTVTKPLPNADFAFLPVCQTAMGAESLSEEVGKFWKVCFLVLGTIRSCWGCKLAFVDVNVYVQFRVQTIVEHETTPRRQTRALRR